MSNRNGWTTHGHPIPGQLQSNPRPKNIARCGGVKLCTTCQEEAKTPTKPTELIQATALVICARSPLDLPAALVAAGVTGVHRPEPDARKPWHDAQPGEVWVLSVDEPRKIAAMTVVKTLHGTRFRDSDKHGTIYALDTPTITHARRIWPAEERDGK